VTLHILFASPWSGSAFASCIAALAPGDALLLCGDGVYAALPRAAAELQIVAEEVRVCALAEDCSARGLRTLPEGILPLDYPGFVALAVEQPRAVSWF
jgi:tRNA 2-thiouridine synthesizing protein B